MLTTTTGTTPTRSARPTLAPSRPVPARTPERNHDDDRRSPGRDRPPGPLSRPALPAPRQPGPAPGYRQGPAATPPPRRPPERSFAAGPGRTGARGMVRVRRD